MGKAIALVLVVIVMAGCTIEGPAGTSGATWLSGAGAPADSLGVAGDFYLDTATCRVYQKVEAAWTYLVCIQGTATAWHTGTGTPDPSLGSDGDLYLNTATGEIYKKASGAWSLYMDVTPAAIRKSGTVAAGGSLTLEHNITATDGTKLTYTGEFASGGRIYPYGSYSSVYPGLAQVEAATTESGFCSGTEGVGRIVTTALPSGRFAACYVDTPEGTFLRVAEFQADGTFIDSLSQEYVGSYLKDMTVVPWTNGFACIRAMGEGSDNVKAYLYADCGDGGTLTSPREVVLLEETAVYTITSLAACTLESGLVAVVWSGTDSVTNAVTCFQTLDPVSGSFTAPVQLNSTTLVSLSASALKAGGLVIAYTPYFKTVPSVAAQVLTASGAATGSEITPLYSDSSYYARVAGLSGGGFVVTYMYSPEYGTLVDAETGYDDGQGRFAIYDSGGAPISQAPLGGSFAARGTNPFFVSLVDVTALSTGGFAVAYRRLEENSGNTPARVKVCLFGEGGALLAPAETFLTHGYTYDSTNGSLNVQDFVSVSLCSSGPRIFLSAGYNDYSYVEQAWALDSGCLYHGLYRADSLTLTEGTGSATLANNTGGALVLRLSVDR